MISGRVNEQREAVVALQVTGLADPVDAVVDTGFSGAVCLAREVAEELSLHPVGAEAYELGDGSMTQMNVYLIGVRWFDDERVVRAILTESRQSVIGTELLRGCRLEIDFAARTVSVQRARTGT